MAKLKTTVGVAAGIFNTEGKLLLRRRIEHDSITGIDYYGCWELPVVAVQTQRQKSIPYNYLVLELIRGIKAEVGISIRIFVDPMPAFYPVMLKFKNEKKGKYEYDLAMITPIYAGDVAASVSGQDVGGEVIFVSPEELNNLAREYKPAKKNKEGKIIESGKGLLSGFGKRQHCLALRAFEAASLLSFQREASETLREIERGWFK